MQLQTGHLWLVFYAKLHRFREDNKYKYKARATVIYILINCLRLSALQQKLKKEIGEVFNNIIHILEDRDKREFKKLDSSAQARSAVNTVLDFTEISLRF
jgi:arginine utilization protein RocB